MKDKLIKINRIVGIVISLTILLLYVLEIFPVSTMIFITLIDVFIMLIMGNVVIPIVIIRYEIKKIDEINIRLDLNGHRRYNQMLYNSDDALKIIDYLHENNIELYGIDAFELIGEGIQPQSYCPDYSKQDNKEDVYELAKNDIEQFTSENESFLYEIVYKI